MYFIVQLSTKQKLKSLFSGHVENEIDYDKTNQAVSKISNIYIIIKLNDISE